MMRTVTVAWLKQHHAYEEQVAVFEQEWGEEMELSAANIRRGAELHLDLGWLAIRLLTYRDLGYYMAEEVGAWARYKAERAGAWARYEAERAGALIRALGLGRYEEGISRFGIEEIL